MGQRFLVFPTKNASQALSSNSRKAAVVPELEQNGSPGSDADKRADKESCHCEIDQDARQSVQQSHAISAIPF